MQHDPAPNKLHGGLADEQDQLSDQDQGDKAQILIVDTDIYDGLGKKRKDKLQQAGDQNAQGKLNQVSAVWFQIGNQVPEIVFPDRFIIHRVKIGARFQEQSDTLFFTLFLGTDPSLKEF